jgi:apolipoprotein N-acyltransferase
MNVFEKPWFGALAALATGLLFLASLDLGPVGPLALIAPVPLLLYALRAPSAWSVALAAFGARVIGMAMLVVVYTALPPTVFVVMGTLFGGSYALVILLTRWLARSGHPVVAVLAYPLLLTALEFGFALNAPDGSFGSMGYALVDILPLLQLASLGGMAALTFILALVPSVIAVGLTRPEARRTALITGAVPLVLALTFGFIRLTQDYDRHERVALIGIDAHEATAYQSAAHDEAAAKAFAEEIRKAAAEKPAYIVLPEKQLGGARDAEASIGIIRAAAEEVAIPVVAGFDEVHALGPRMNSALWLAPGQTTERYIKRRFIPGLETGYAMGAESWVRGANGIAICKDMDFPQLIRDYGARNVEIMLVPAWDFVRDGRLHSRMAVVRGVENGFAIARAAAAGKLTASDRYGRIVAEATTDREKAVSVVAEIGLKSGGTLYARLGDVFAWMCVVGAVGLLGWRGWRQFKRRERT